MFYRNKRVYFPNEVDKKNVPILPSKARLNWLPGKGSRKSRWLVWYLPHHPPGNDQAAKT